MERIRVSSLQYFIRPVQTFNQFRDQVEALVETAADYNCQLLVFPEYFTVQLLTLGNVKRPIREQIQDLARQGPAYLELMEGRWPASTRCTSSAAASRSGANRRRDL